MKPMTFTQVLRGVAAAFAFTAVASGASAQTLKLGHITPPTHVWHQVSEKIATDLEKASGGKMKVAVSPLQKLGNEAQMINLMQAGAQQLGVFTVGGLSNREESLLGWSLPYVFKDVAHATRAANTPCSRASAPRAAAGTSAGAESCGSACRPWATPTETPDQNNKPPSQRPRAACVLRQSMPASGCAGRVIDHHPHAAVDAIFRTGRVGQFGRAFAHPTRGSAGPFGRTSSLGFGGGRGWRHRFGRGVAGCPRGAEGGVARGP